MDQKESKKIVERKKWFNYGESIANTLGGLNIVAVVICLLIAVFNGNILLGLYGFLAGTASLLFCILAVAVFSIQEEVSGMRNAQMNANQINEESMKLLRYMAKQMSEKSAK